MEMLGSVSRSGDGGTTRNGRWTLRPVPITKVDERIMEPSSTSEGIIIMSDKIGITGGGGRSVSNF